MPQVTISLFDFSDPENPKEPLHMRLDYPAEQDPLAFGDRKITIAAGDDVACGTVSLPLDLLSSIMAQLLEADRQRNSGGLVGFNKPNIILPN